MATECRADGGDDEQHQATIDGVVKVNGIAASLAGFLQTVPGDTELGTIGANLQVSKVFGETTRRMVGAARYAVIIPQGDGADDPTHEIVLGWGWLPHGHNAKLQLDLSSQIAPDADFADHLIARLQAQLAF